MARLVIATAAAAVAGYFSGGTAALQTFALVYGATGFLDPNSTVLGPRLQDLRSPQASYGSPIAYIEGAPRVAGCYIWSSSKREVATTTSEGKGGPGVDSTVFTYEIDVLIELAVNRCQAIRRIWSNGKLVWSKADDADGETLIASENTIAWRDLRFYDGNPTQLPDPTYEAAVGVGNAPAYRTRTTLMIEGLNLGNSGQLPVLTFEVVSEADLTYTGFTFATFPLLPEYNTKEFVGGISAMDPSGFDFIYGVDYDIPTGGHSSYNVYHVDGTGAITLTANFAYDPTTGTGTGKEGNALQGNSDESVLVVYEFDPAFIPQIDHFTMYRTNGTSVAFDFGVPDTNDQWTFSKRGDRVAITSSTFAGTQEVRTYNATSGALIAVGVMSEAMQFCAIGEGVVFALGASSNIFEIDLETATLNQTITAPLSATQSAITCDADGALYLFALGTFGNQYPVYKWDGAAWTLLLNETLLYSVPSDRHAYYASPDFLGLQRFDSSGSAPYREQFNLATKRVTIIEPTLADVVERLCIRTGQLESADLTLTDLESDIVRSLAITQVSSTRVTLESLMAAYLFEWAESATLRSVKRGGSSVATIPYTDLGVSEDGNAEPLPKTRVNDMEQVARVSVRYSNVDNDSQDGLEQADRLTTESQAEAVVEIPVGFTPTEAKRLADANTMDLAVSGTQIGPIALSRKYAKIEVADPFLVTGADGSTFRVRAVGGKIGAGVNTFELKLDDASAINSAALTDTDYFSSSLVALLSETDMEILDIPILRDDDDSLGPYIAIEATGTRWSSAVIDKSSDDTTFVKVATMTTQTVIGTATTVLGNCANPWVFDDVNSVTVDVGDAALFSTTRTLAIDEKTTAYLIGSEIIVAATATLISPGVYTLTELLRGRRGTEWATGTHAADDRFVVLQNAGLLKVEDVSADLSALRYYRATTGGRTLADSEAFTDTGVAKKPFAVVDLHYNSVSGVVTWSRRSRLDTRLFALVAVPLGEDSESYEVELYNASAVLVSTSTVTSPSFTAGTSIPGYSVTVYQRSATVGRGYPATLQI